MIEWFRLVVHADIPSRELQGWRVVNDDLGPTHGYWAVLMKWFGEGDPA